MGLLLIRYGEIALKGKNRPFFERTLHRNIENSLKGLEPFRVIYRRGRFFVNISDEYLFLAQKRLQKVFGIISINPAHQTKLDMEEISRGALETLSKNYQPGITFKVEARRPNKNFPYTSPEINQKIGEYLLKSHLDLKVDVHNPQTTVKIEVREDNAYIYTDAAKGPGGLPVGVAGRGLLLLSGGIDSPIAGWMGMKRGVEIEALHFHSPPFTGKGALNKAVDLCQVLSSYSGKIKLHLIPVTDIQKELRLKCSQEKIITLLRRAMFRLADQVAQQRRIPVLFTGESLGQVASQTLENLVVTDQTTSLPVLRPLIGLDKQEITNIAREINSYEISIRPYEDCCTLFIPEHPVTRPSAKDLEKEEAQIPLRELIQDSLDKIETKEIFPLS